MGGAVAHVNHPRGFVSQSRLEAPLVPFLHCVCYPPEWTTNPRHLGHKTQSLLMQNVIANFNVKFIKTKYIFSNISWKRQTTP